VTDIQSAAIAKAQASMKPALDLYDQRTKLMHLICKVPLCDLIRLNLVIDQLSECDLKRVCAYAEGLAEWGSVDASSPDASSSDW
jgi:hypothetical protein